MQTLTIKDFSCIKQASIELKPLTLIIGPQASGKSVISKLFYFCTGLISDCERYLIDEQLSYEDFIKRTSTRFNEWFPISAWGEKRFAIKFELGKFNLQICRIGKSERTRIIFSPEFEAIYRELSQAYSSILEKIDAHPEKDEFEVKWTYRDKAVATLKKWMTPNAYIESQLFIPAGRSFFTSIGKALVAFEHSGILDPITLEFGRRFSNLREQHLRRFGSSKRDFPPLANVLFSEILGGTLKFENGKDYIQSADGRLIPFSALSSGQQEILPLALSIRSMLPSANNDSPLIRRTIRRAIYIEEPEAHLFPRAQNRLVEILASLVAKRRPNNLLITTHSPYVLAKFNNLIKAGQLGRKYKAGEAKELAEIIPETSWIKPGSVNAYAIIENKLTNIMDDDGLIAADYLDDVSSDISIEFTKLLGYELK